MAFRHAVLWLLLVVLLFPQSDGFCRDDSASLQKGYIMIFKPRDRKISEALLQSALREEKAAMPINELVLSVGRSFLGVPYVSRTLERRGPEDLVINLRQLDCFTFLENAVALARLIRERKTAFEDYAAALQETRYRKGVLDGYASRLHYFCDWLNDNGQKGIVRDITRDIGGQPFPKEINYMTANAGQYPALRKEESFGQIRQVEDTMSRQCRYYIPKRALKNFEENIRDGDLIAITTGIRGLDVAHVGLAVHVGKKIHLLHASKAAGKVVISARTLSGYLAGQKNRTGIIVGRVL